MQECVAITLYHMRMVCLVMRILRLVKSRQLNAYGKRSRLITDRLPTIIRYFVY